MNEKKDISMRSAVEEFIASRINACDMRSNAALEDAWTKFRGSVERLTESLTDEQMRLYRGCDNAWSQVDGETHNCYYRAGFSDAMEFILGWRNGSWN